MAVVISQEGGDKEEEKAFTDEGLNIKPHRYLIDHPDEDGRNIEDYFKDPNNAYRIVFVTAMWMTGFDAPSVSTLYLVKKDDDSDEYPAKEFEELLLLLEQVMLKLKHIAKNFGADV
ncbi:MAG: hypothetical protein IPN14_08350 [Bacteroidetes bacterium]|nr:hypothetical protein [Bacteroidota bacterium]